MEEEDRLERADELDVFDVPRWSLVGQASRERKQWWTGGAITQNNCLRREYWEDAADLQSLIVRVMDLGIESGGFTTEVFTQIQKAFLPLYRRARNRGYTAVAEIYEVYANSCSSWFEMESQCRMIGRPNNECWNVKRLAKCQASFSTLRRSAKKWEPRSCLGYP